MPPGQSVCWTEGKQGIFHGEVDQGSIKSELLNFSRVTVCSENLQELLVVLEDQLENFEIRGKKWDNIYIII